MQDNPLPPALLRVQEAAAYMAISERSIWNLVKQGKLPAVRFGKIMRIERGDLDQFIRVAKTGDPHESFLAASNLRGGREQ